MKPQRGKKTKKKRKNQQRENVWKKEWNHNEMKYEEKNEIPV